jgi:hypothetical protein
VIVDISRNEEKSSANWYSYRNFGYESGIHIDFLNMNFKAAHFLHSPSSAISLNCFSVNSSLFNTIHITQSIHVNRALYAYAKHTLPKTKVSSRTGRDPNTLFLIIIPLDVWIDVSHICPVITIIHIKYSLNLPLNTHQLHPQQYIFFTQPLHILLKSLLSPLNNQTI